MVEPKVMIGIPTAEFGKREDFHDYLSRAQKPNCIQLSPHGSSPAHNRNIIIRCALENDCTHVMFFDNDMAFQADIIPRLLARDRDIVTGLYYHRNYAHQPIIFDKIDAKGRAFAYFLNEDTPDMLKIAACGFGCCLIKTEIFKKMEKPWIRLGEIDADQWCDDIGFFARIKKNQITDDIWCDTTVRVGHIATMIIWPDRDESGKFHTMYDTVNPMNGTGQVKFPQFSPESVEVGG